MKGSEGLNGGKQGNASYNPYNKLGNIAKNFTDFAAPQVVALVLGIIPENLKIKKQTFPGQITYFQALINILENKGVKGMFTGVGYGLGKKAFQSGLLGVSIIPLSESVRPLLPKEILEKNPDAHYMAAALPAAAITTAVSKPFDNPRVYSVTAPNGTSILHAMIKQPYDRDGIKGVASMLTRGYIPSFAIRSGNIIGYHMFYPTFKKLFEEVKGSSAGSKENAAIGFVTGVTLGLFTAPIARAVTEMTKHGSGGDAMGGAMQKIVKMNGWRGLFTGCAVHLVHAGLSGSAYSEALRRVGDRQAQRS